MKGRDSDSQRPSAPGYGSDASDLGRSEAERSAASSGFGSEVSGFAGSGHSLPDPTGKSYLSSHATLGYEPDQAASAAAVRGLVRRRVTALLATVLALTLGGWILATIRSELAAKRRAPAPGTTCVGPARGALNLVYLHGIDPPGFSPQEQENRRAIARLADELGIRVALARSPSPCPKDPTKRCWPNTSRAAVESTYDALLADAAPCFGGQAPQAVLGFSNGGYFVGKLFQYCLAPSLSLIGVGGAGSFKAGESRDLAACGRLTLMIGKDDVTRPAAIDFAGDLKKLHGNVRLREYPGGHVLPPAEVKAAVAALLGR